MLRKAATALSLVAVLAFTGAAFAGKTSGSSSIAGPFLVAASPAGSPLTASSTSTPRFGDTITFNVSTTATSNPFVNLNCYQNGGLVMDSWSAFFPGGVNQNFALYSPSWQSGAADCTADLGMLTNNGKWKVLASTSFRADA
jgi:hypothetical protein